MKTNKRELTVFAVCAYAVPFLMMPLLYICLQNGQDTSIFANAQMFYPAAGVMLAFLLARRPDTPKRFYILHLLVTAIMLDHECAFRRCCRRESGYILPTLLLLSHRCWAGFCC